MPKPTMFALGVILAAGIARADVPSAPTAADLLGARALALSGYRGIAPGNDGIFSNPAGLAARRRYAVEGDWIVDRAGADTDLQLLTGSVVDSQSGPVTGAVAYSHIGSARYTGSVYDVSFAAPIAEKLYLGGTGKYLSLVGPANDEMRAATADAALFWQAAEFLSFGAAGYNLIPVGHRQQAPLGIGAGIAIGTETSFHLAGDWRGDFDRRGKLTSAYAAGAEVLIADMFPVRAGYLNDETLGGQWWSAGAGVVTQNGVALDVGYRQSIEHPGFRTIGVALKIFVLGL